jgi:hypothetical protein
MTPIVDASVHLTLDMIASWRRAAMCSHVGHSNGIYRWSTVDSEPWFREEEIIGQQLDGTV